MSEKMHWYTEDGEARHGATLREARKEDLLPSVTKITSVLHNHALIEYAKDQVLKAALFCPPDGKDYDTWKKEVIAKSNEHRDSAADLGTMLHGWVEMYLSGNSVPQEEYNSNEDARRIWSYFQPWADSHLEVGGRQEITLVSKKHRYAGRTDYVGPMIDDNREFVIDWKFRNIKHPGHKKDGDLKAVRKPVYDTDVLQLSAYLAAKAEMDGKEADMFSGHIQPLSVVVSTNIEFPYIYVHEWPMDEVKQWHEAFVAARTLARIMWGI